MSVLKVIKDFCGVEEVKVLDAKINVVDFNGLVSPINKNIMEKSCENVKRLEEELTIPKDRKTIVEKKQKPKKVMNIDNDNKNGNVRNKGNIEKER